MKKILCYGDSNTFGYNPAFEFNPDDGLNSTDGLRYDENTRWTALLQTALPEDYQIIEEGLCDRTGFVNNPKGFEFSAQRHFPKLLSKYDIIDVIILALGTNDLQSQYDISYGAVEKGLENLILLAREKSKDIILIPPVILSEKILDGFFSFQFDETSIIKSRKVGKIYKKLALLYNCKLFDINKFTQPSDIDGLHYDSESHKLISDKLSTFLSNLN